MRLVKNGHAESARRFLNRECGETPEQPSTPVGCRQWQVPAARPGAPPGLNSSPTFAIAIPPVAVRQEVYNTIKYRERYGIRILRRSLVSPKVLH